jgi:hypothetical protein
VEMYHQGEQQQEDEQQQVQEQHRIQHSHTAAAPCRRGDRATCSRAEPCVTLLGMRTCRTVRELACSTARRGLQSSGHSVKPVRDLVSWCALQSCCTALTLPAHQTDPC